MLVIAVINIAMRQFWENYLCVECRTTTKTNDFRHFGKRFSILIIQKMYVRNYNNAREGGHIRSMYGREGCQQAIVWNVITAFFVGRSLQ